MSDAFRPIELLDTARALYGTRSMAGLPSAQRVAASVVENYDRIAQSFRHAARNDGAIVFISAPAGPVARSWVANQWVGVAMPTDDKIDFSSPSVTLTTNSAIFCLWLSLIGDIAASKGPKHLLAKEAALRFWFSSQLGQANVLVFSPRDKASSVDGLIRPKLMVA